jgi:hypothetical protein
MVARIPTIGYASRTDAVEALRKAGLSTDEIVSKLSISKVNVYSLEREAKVRCAKRDRTTRRVRFAVLLTEQTLKDLHPHADLRNITANKLCQHIIEAVVSRNAIDDILNAEGR